MSDDEVRGFMNQVDHDGVGELDCAQFIEAVLLAAGTAKKKTADRRSLAIATFAITT